MVSPLGSPLIPEAMRKMHENHCITQPLNAALEKLQEQQEKGIQLRDRDPDEPPSWGRESPQMTPTPSPSPSPACQTLATPPYPTPLSLSPSNSATAGTKRKRGDDHGAEDEPPRKLRARIADLADEETHGVFAMKGQQSANSEEQTSPTSGVSKSNAASTSNAVPVKSRIYRPQKRRVRSPPPSAASSHIMLLRSCAPKHAQMRGSPHATLRTEHIGVEFATDHRALSM
jgi:hypothetical protein